MIMLEVYFEIISSYHVIINIIQGSELKMIYIFGHKIATRYKNLVTTLKILVVKLILCKEKDGDWYIYLQCFVHKNSKRTFKNTKIVSHSNSTRAMLLVQKWLLLNHIFL